MTIAGREDRSSSKPSPRRASGFGQMKYVFQCTYCNKKFERTKYDAALNHHKTKDGYACPGRAPCRNQVLSFREEHALGRTIGKGHRQ